MNKHPRGVWSCKLVSTAQPLDRQYALGFVLIFEYPTSNANFSQSAVSTSLNIRLCVLYSMCGTIPMLF